MTNVFTCQLTSSNYHGAVSKIYCQQTTSFNTRTETDDTRLDGQQIGENNDPLINVRMADDTSINGQQAVGADD